MSDYKKRRQRGMALLKKMGREELMLDQKALYPDLYEMSVGHLFGDVWARPGLSLRDRQLVTLAANIAMARPTGNFSHYRSAKHIGITHKEIAEYWPEEEKPSKGTLYAWLNLAFDRKLVRRDGRGTKNDPWRYRLENEDDQYRDRGELPPLKPLEPLRW